jgi:competence protein ComEC
MQQRLAALMPGPQHSLYARLLEGLVLGVHQTPLPEELITQFRRAGTIHLMVVSGSQVTLLACLFVYPLLLVRDGGQRTTYPRLRIALTLLSLPVLAFYVALADRGPSIDRSVFMVLLGAMALFLAVSRLAHVRSFRPDGITLLAAAALVMLIARPAMLFSPGAQLSFAAVFGLIAITPVLMRLLHRLLGPFSLLPAATLGAQLMVAPVLAWHFGSIPLLAPFTNLLAVPLVAVLLPLGLLAYLVVLPLPLLAGWLVGISAPLIRLLLGINQLAAPLPCAELRWYTHAWWQVAVYYLVLGALLMLLSRTLNRLAAEWPIPAGRAPRMW